MWLAVVIAIMAPAGWEAKEWVKHQDGFCVSCHSPEGKPFHKVKHDRMTATMPVTLAGAHYSLERGRLSCPDCHRGVGMAGRAHEALLEIKNSLVYLAGSFKEPEKITLHISNQICEPCHTDLKAKGINPEYHFFASHDGIKDPLCVECHPQHALKTAGGEFLNKEVVVKVCEQCHSQARESAFIIRSLKMRNARPTAKGGGSP
ncbi:hypothetical protein MNBD_NITROSPINAE02-1842 [hydrothermal vent metagenome]|uniref:Uncharacterized protein n=1 Tax=hydrothermal vent metagenome TaxID=652676 RepID=A0A3B1CLP3_9ZZZZ